MPETRWQDSRVKRVRRSMRDVFREALISGLAVVVPLVVTAFVVLFLFDFVYQYLGALSTVVVETDVLTVPGVGIVSRQRFVELLTPVVLLATILLVGLVVNSSRYAERAVGYFDYVMSEIPGVGSIYDSFRRMSDVMLDSDAENFRDVKLVEFPHEGAYTLGFVTTDTPDVLSTPAGYPDMKTLFLPLAPNPVMGGHLVHLPEDRVIDVEMTVEEGIQAVVTSGVAISDADGGGEVSLSEAQLRDLSGVERADRQTDPGGDDPYDHRRDSVQTDRAARYDAEISPDRADTPRCLERRENPGDRASTEGTPAEMAGRTPEEAEATDGPPATSTRADRSEGNDAERADAEESPPTRDDPAADRKREGDGDADPSV